MSLKKSSIVVASALLFSVTAPVFAAVDQATADGAKLKEVFDPDAATWSAAPPVSLGAEATDLATLFFAETPDGALVRDVLGATLLYAADLVPDIADDVVAVDRAMRWGYAWGAGPFELIDRIEPARLIADLRRDGRPLPRMLAVLERASAARFYDDDGVLGPDGRRHPLPAA